MLTGTLTETNIDKLFRLLHQQRQTGALRLEWAEESVQIMLQEGRIAHIDGSSRKMSMRTGELLVSGQVISRNTLLRALENQMSDNRTLGAISIGMWAHKPSALLGY